jgi:hypothetical protein
MESNLFESNSGVQQKERQKTFDEMLKKREEVKGEVVEKVKGNSQWKKPEMNQYNYDEAIASSTEYFKGDPLAASVWVNKYALNDSQGNIN